MARISTFLRERQLENTEAPKDVTVEGIAAEKKMFAESGIVILRYVEDDGKDHDIIVSAPRCFREENNYYNTDDGKWIYD